jgi:hypothetical protein
MVVLKIIRGGQLGRPEYTHYPSKQISYRFNGTKITIQKLGNQEA